MGASGGQQMRNINSGGRPFSKAVFSSLGFILSCAINNIIRSASVLPSSSSLKNIKKIGNTIYTG